MSVGCVVRILLLNAFRWVLQVLRTRSFSGRVSTFLQHVSPKKVPSKPMPTSEASWFASRES